MQYRLEVLFLTLLLVGSGTGRAQVTVFPEKTQVLYVGIENPLKVITCDIDIKKLLVTSADAEIVQKPGAGIAILPRKTGMIEVIVRQIARRDTNVIERFQFRALPVPSPKAQIGGHSSADGNFGRISLNVLKAQIGVSAGTQCTESGWRFTVTTFTLATLRQGGTWQDLGVAQNAYFTEPMKNALKTLKPGDRIIVTGILANNPAARNIGLEPILLQVE